MKVWQWAVFAKPGIAAVCLMLGGCLGAGTVRQDADVPYALLEKSLVAAAEGRLELLIRYQELESRFSPVSGLFSAESLPPKEAGGKPRQHIHVAAAGSQTRLRVDRVLAIQLQPRAGVPYRGEVEAVLEVHSKTSTVETTVEGELGTWWGPQPFRITDRLSLWSDRPLPDAPQAVRDAWDQAEAAMKFVEPQLQHLRFRMSFDYDSASRSWRVDPRQDEVARELEPYLKLANLQELELAVQQAQGPQTGKDASR